MAHNGRDFGCIRASHDARRKSGADSAAEAAMQRSRRTPIARRRPEIAMKINGYVFGVQSEIAGPTSEAF